MFRPVPTEADFRAVESEVLEFWARHDVFGRSLTERDGQPDFVFYEGPPTANGKPGLHHVWARVYKDLFCRFQTMRGRRVLRRAGWDTHGLPVEVEVEKQLGFSGKDQIEAYGVAAFVQACRESVYAYVEDWKRLTERIGFWVDTDDAYWTLTSEYVQSVWWHLRQLWDRGLLFDDVKVVPYCPRCGTALSSHELGQPDVYRDVEDVSAYVRLPVDGTAPDGVTALVVWTTTPWTLPSNTGVAVHPNLTYVVIDGLVVAEDRAEAVFGAGALARVRTRLPGTQLVGVRYRRPIDAVEVPATGDGWRVVPAEFVNADEGTGLVHIAPAFGADDWALGRAEGLPTINPVGPDGHFTDAAGWLAGLPVRQADPKIIDRLEGDGLLIRAEPHLHSYPHCWRCGTALIYWGKPSWYVATASRKDDLLAANESVTWRPENIKHGRMGEWLANNVDWALSRDRFWGTPLPIWKCAQGHAHCVASLAELSELVGRDVTDVDPHRPVIDEVTFPCDVCGEPSQRVEAVIDAWFDSGSMPMAQWGYPHVPGSAERVLYPADFITEAVDQTRGWFYSLLAVNVLVHDRPPYRAALSLGHIVDADGRKMSKSIGNVIDPWTVLETRGADPLRWWMFHQGSPWTATRTSLEAIDASTGDVLMTLWNTWNFFATYASLSDFAPDDARIPAPADRGPLDRWARSRLHRTIAEVTASLDDYQPLAAANAIGALADDLSNWYVRRSRRRFWRTDADVDASDGLAANATLYECLVDMARLLAPFCPFLAERIWRDLTNAPADASVHLADWPTVDPAAGDPGLEAQMALARRLVSLGRSARTRAGVKVRQPLRRAVVVVPPTSPPLLADIVADELNVDAVTVATGAGEVLSFELVPNYRTLGPRLGKAVPELPAALARLDAAAAVEAVEGGRPITIDLPSGPVELQPEDVEVRVKPLEGFAVSREATEAVALDLELDDDLRLRGLLRDVIREIQELRRARGLAVSDRIRLHLAGLDQLAGRTDDIGREVLAVDVTFGAGNGDGATLDLDGVSASVWITPA